MITLRISTLKLRFPVLFFNPNLFANKGNPACSSTNIKLGEFRHYSHDYANDKTSPCLIRGIDYLRDPRLNKVSSLALAI